MNLRTLAMLGVEILLGLSFSIAQAAATTDCRADIPEYLEVSDRNKLIKACDQLLVATKQTAVLTQQNLNATQEKTNQDMFFKAAERKLEVANKLKEAAAAALTYPKIKVETAVVYSQLDPNRNCNAIGYIREKCEGKETCGTITVDAEICGNPDLSKNLLLDVTYFCDDVKNTDYMGVENGNKFTLTCKITPEKPN